MDSFLEQIKGIHLNPKAIIDAGGTIDGQLLEEHRGILIKKVGDLSEEARVRIRQDRQKQIKEARNKDISQDELKQVLKNIDRWVEIGENTIVLLEDSKIKELNEQT